MLLRDAYAVNAILTMLRARLLDVGLTRLKTRHELRR